MSEITKQPSAAERLQELQTLNKQREELLRRQAVLQSQNQQANREYESLTKEMQDANTSHATIELDVAQSKTLLNQSMVQYTEDLARFRSTIETAEKAVQN